MSADVIPFPDLLKLDYAEIPGRCQIIILPVLRIDRRSSTSKPSERREKPTATLRTEDLRPFTIKTRTEDLKKLRKDLEVLTWDHVTGGPESRSKP